jgi:hypothetical protein
MIAALLLALVACLPNASDPAETPRSWGPPPAPVREEDALPGGIGARAVAGVTPLWPVVRGTPPRGMKVQGTRVRLSGTAWEAADPGQWSLPLPLVPDLVMTGLRVDDSPCGMPAPTCTLVGGRLTVGGVVEAPRRLAFNVPPELALREAVLRGRNLEKGALSTAAYRVDDEAAPVVVLGETAVQVTLAQLGSGAVLRFRPRFLPSAIFAGQPAPIPLEVVGARSGGEPKVVWSGTLDPAAAAAAPVSIPLDPAVFPAWSLLVIKARPRPEDALAGVAVLADLAVHVGPK